MQEPHNSATGTKDGQVSLSAQEWSQWIDGFSEALHADHRWRLLLLMDGMLFAQERHTVASWLRAAGISDDFQGNYDFVSAVGKRAEAVAERLLALMFRIVSPRTARAVRVGRHADEALRAEGRRRGLAPQSDAGAGAARAAVRWQSPVTEILAAVADRAAIKQNFHDQKEVEGFGQVQLRNVWANVGACHWNLWLHTLIELRGWHQPASALCDRRDSPWDAPTRRPSHANRRKALRQVTLEHNFRQAIVTQVAPSKITRPFKTLCNLVA